MLTQNKLICPDRRQKGGRELAVICSQTANMGDRFSASSPRDGLPEVKRRTFPDIPAAVPHCLKGFDQINCLLFSQDDRLVDYSY